MISGRDLVVLLDVASRGTTPAASAKALRLPVSEVRAALRRAEGSRLYSEGRQAVNRLSLFEYLMAARYVYPAIEERTGVRRRRGVPTAWSTSPIREHISAAGAVVWPSPDGDVLGTYVLEPLDPLAVEAAPRLPPLHELLALVDALRAGRARERTIARHELKARLS